MGRTGGSLTDARKSPGLPLRSGGVGAPRAGTGRLLEAYWSGFAAWLLGRLEGGWWPCPRRRGDVADRLRAATLDVGEALVVARHTGATGRDRLRLAADRWGWLLGLAAQHGTLGGPDLARAREAQRVLEQLLGHSVPEVPPARSARPVPTP